VGDDEFLLDPRMMTCAARMASRRSSHRFVRLADHTLTYQIASNRVLGIGEIALDQ
jgi:hypothetical protein